MFKAKFRILLQEASELLQGARNPSNFHPHRNSSDIVVTTLSSFTRQLWRELKTFRFSYSFISHKTDGTNSFIHEVLRTAGNMLIANIVPDDDAAEPGGCCPEHSEVEDMFGVQGREKWRVKSFNKTKFFMFHLLTW